MVCEFSKFLDFGKVLFGIFKSDHLNYFGILK
jgi:hypothetical protein